MALRAWGAGCPAEVDAGGLAGGAGDRGGAAFAGGLLGGGGPVLFTLAQRGAFAPDGIIASVVPVTTVAWILALAATLPRSWWATTRASAQAPG